MRNFLVEIYGSQRTFSKSLISADMNIIAKFIEPFVDVNLAQYVMSELEWQREHDWFPNITLFLNENNYLTMEEKDGPK